MVWGVEEWCQVVCDIAGWCRWCEVLRNDAESCVVLLGGAYGVGC